MILLVFDKIISTTMPNPTRHQQFIRSFDKFIDMIIELDNLPSLAYKLKSFTGNKTCRDHEYMFTIPRNVVSYRVESNSENVENQTVNTRQTIPSIENLKQYVDMYFFEHRLKIGDTFMSFVDMVSEGYTDDDAENGEFIAKIEVCYYKSHIPFPSRLTADQETNRKINMLEQQVRHLQGELRNTNEMYQDMAETADRNRRLIRRERSIAKEKYSTLFEKMERKVCEFYKDAGKSEDCPVCYEVIDSTKLKVPGCCHFICTDCSQRCATCPICREEYIS
jgi:hypothetical protein